MATATQRATLDDLYRYPGKAELINGRIVPLMATGRRPNRIASRIFRSLDDYAQAQGAGEAYTDNMGFAIPMLPSGREAFNPDASYYNGPFPANDMRFIQGPPTFAVEVRSENDYGDAAEAQISAKRVDYFASGTLVVWDVDPVADTIACYRAATPTQAMTFRRGDVTDAEPAVPGWRIDVSTIFA
jgi:Uma2 family endonuclease